MANGSNGWPTPSTTTASTTTTTTTRPMGQSPGTRNQAQQAQQPNAWLNGSNYDPAEFYTRATNLHDHAEAVHAKVRPDLLRLVEEVVGSGLIPEYRTNADFVRDAIVHRLQWIQENLASGDLQQVLAGDLERTRMIRMIGREKGAVDDWKIAIAEFIETAAGLVDEGDWWALIGLVSKIEQESSVYPAPWGPRFAGICKEFRAKIPADFNPEADPQQWTV